jgi:hypothetical protein
MSLFEERRSVHKEKRSVTIHKECNCTTRKGEMYTKKEVYSNRVYS